MYVYEISSEMRNIDDNVYTHVLCIAQQHSQQRTCTVIRENTPFDAIWKEIQKMLKTRRKLDFGHQYRHG